MASGKPIIQIQTSALRAGGAIIRVDDAINPINRLAKRSNKTL